MRRLIHEGGLALFLAEATAGGSHNKKIYCAVSNILFFLCIHETEDKRKKHTTYFVSRGKIKMQKSINPKYKENEKF